MLQSKSSLIFAEGDDISVAFEAMHHLLLMLAPALNNH